MSRTDPDLDLIARLRRMSDNHSLGDEAANRLEELRRKLCEVLCDCQPRLCGETDPTTHARTCLYVWKMTLEPTDAEPR